MHFAPARLLIAIALVWAVLLVGYDQHANPRPFAAYWAEFKGSSTRPVVTSPKDVPRLKLSMPHLCCSGCLSDLRTALEPLTWLAAPSVAVEPPSIDNVEEVSPDAANANELDVEIVDLSKVDFVALGRALEDAGLTADKIEIYGMGHFRLEVELPHLCCTVCSRAADEQLDRLLRKEEQRRWFDSLTVNHVKKTVVVYARMNSVVDVVELTTALGRAGFFARAIRVASGPES
jgi:hypothetical protein